jgi:hypothetical protein
VPYRRDQVDDKQADGAVLPAWCPERAFRKPTGGFSRSTQQQWSDLFDRFLEP